MATSDMRLPSEVVGNREVKTNDPISADKLWHKYRATERFGNLLSGGAETAQIGTRAKVGGTAGWVVAAADNLPYVATLPASQSGSTLVIPIDGLEVGDTITGFRVVAQVESAGGTVTIDGDLRATTNVAADPTDASIGTMTQVSVTADTAASQAKTGLTEVVTSGKTYYLKITATTAASTDIILQACEITVTPAVAPVTVEVVLFQANKTGKLDDDIFASLNAAGSSTSIAFDVKKNGTSILSAAISFVHGDGNRGVKTGTFASDSARQYVRGDVVSAIATVTSATGASGPMLTYERLEEGD